MIASYVTYLFNLSISSSTVIEEWKKARVTPLYKGKGSKIDYTSYRPISVISHLAKILEKIIQCQLSGYLEKHNFITPDQSAYLKNHSTQTALLKVTNDWYHNIENGLITGVCFFDISKCFNAIDHDILLFKLEKYGIRGNELSWFKSYLSNRKQATLCNGKISSFENVCTGVPQGSILGPILFLLFMNDLHMHVKNCNLYADDTMLDEIGESVNEVVTSLQCEIDKLSVWFKHNHLTTNASKSCSMLIGSRQRINNFVNKPDLGLSLDGIIISNHSSYRYLGVQIDSFLSFDKMVDNICNKLSSRVSMLLRLSHTVPYFSLNQLYYAFVQPYIDYCILVWGHASETSLNRIQRFQNRSARIVCKLYDFSISGLSIVKSNGWLSVRQRRDFLYCVLIHKCIFGDAPNYLSDQLILYDDVQSSRITRQSSHLLLHVPFIRNHLCRKSFSVYGPSVWNSLPYCIRNCENIIYFKSECKRYLLYQDN